MCLAKAFRDHREVEMIVLPCIWLPHPITTASCLQFQNDQANTASRMKWKTCFSPQVCSTSFLLVALRFFSADMGQILDGNESKHHRLKSNEAEE